MATHSSVLAWRSPGTGQPGGLPSMGLVAQSRTRLKRLNSNSILSWDTCVSGIKRLAGLTILISENFKKGCETESHSVMSDSLWHHGLYSPWNSLGQNTGVGSLSLRQGIFLTQESNPGLPYCRLILYQLNHNGSPRILEWVAYPFPSESNHGLLHCRRILYQLRYQGSPSERLRVYKSAQFLIDKYTHQRTQNSRSTWFWGYETVAVHLLHTVALVYKG